MCVHQGVLGEDEIQVDATKRPPILAAISLLGDAVRSRDEGRVINKMLFKDLTSHSLMAAQWVPQVPSLDNARAPVWFKNWLVLKGY